MILFKYQYYILSRGILFGLFQCAFLLLLPVFSFTLTVPLAPICMGKNRTKARKLQVALSTSLFYEKSQEQKKPEFLEKYKKRSAQEWKNGEMKRFHGLSRARGWGLRSILFQAKLTAIAVNLKRIAAITGKETLPVIAVFKKIEDYFQKSILNTNFATVFFSADC